MANQPIVPPPVTQPGGLAPPGTPLPRASAAPGRLTRDAKGNPLPPGSAPMPGGANPPIPPEGENPDQAVPLHFMQQPWVQDVLPVCHVTDAACLDRHFRNSFL
jgi:hypothetical protein